MIRVRFAPSPTGYLHIGGARAALFNWMYARSQDGKFILRIEDTDLERSKQEYCDEIIQSMAWLGFTADEVYRQRERFELYRREAERLVQEDKAYRDGPAVLLKKTAEEIRVFDLIRGEIQFDPETLKDEVLMKSDGSPTYGFACVVDDALMEISHVIRGEDHISNTPKQIMIYQALGFKPPKFAHLPLIMGADGARLSKRTGAVAVSDYKKEGFLPEALVNYLMLLGWSPGDNQEIMPLATAIKKFSLKKINKAAAVFSMDKLKWVNGQYIKQKDPDALTKELASFLKEKGFIDENCDPARLKQIVGLYKNRMTTFAEFTERTAYLFQDAPGIDPDLQEKYFSDVPASKFQELAKRLAAVEGFDKETAEKAFKEAVAALGLTMADLVHPVRVALTGSDVGPGLFETMELLGQDKTVSRLKNIGAKVN